tara:strand:- start:459 stop:677 length:219 start_codon:yes stop_codon:yes gene_type:complete
MKLIVVFIMTVLTMAILSAIYPESIIFTDIGVYFALSLIIGLLYLNLWNTTPLPNMIKDLEKDHHNPRNKRP